MPASLDVFTTVHFVLLLGFITVTSLLMLVTVANRIRLRRVAASWRVGHFFGLPSWPMAFLLSVCLLFAASALAGGSLQPIFFGGYVAGGLFWLAASILSSTVIVSEYGLVLNVNYADKAITWGQVVDYFEFNKGRKRGYVFFFVDECGKRRRMELVVPPTCRSRMRAIIAARLESRFQPETQESYGSKALEL